MKIWSISWCLVCRFLPILKLLFTLLSSRVLLTNHLFFIDSKWIQKSICFVCHTLEENKTKTKFKIGEKPHTKHHQIDQILMFFDRFDDVWYVVFFQFWNQYCVYFSQGYYQQNYLFFLDRKWIQKRIILLVIPLRKIRQRQVLKLVKTRIPNIIKSIKFSCFLIDLMMFGMPFFTNFETFIYITFFKGMTNKTNALEENGDYEFHFPLEENMD